MGLSYDRISQQWKVAYLHFHNAKKEHSCSYVHSDTKHVLFEHNFAENRGEMWRCKSGRHGSHIGAMWTYPTCVILVLVFCNENRIDDAFSTPSYFASWQDAICNDNSCKWPSGSSNNVVQCRVPLLAQHSRITGMTCVHDTMGL